MGLKKNVIKKEVFDREIALCKMLLEKTKENAAGANAQTAVLFLFCGNYIKVNC